MQSFKEFKRHMDWTTLDLPDEKVKALYDSVDTDSYTGVNEQNGQYFEEGLSSKDYTLFSDANLHSVIEYFEEIIGEYEEQYLELYYIGETDMYAGVLIYS